MSGLTVVAPLGLAALIGLPLIVLFHMRNVTIKSRPMPTLRFWREAQEIPPIDQRFRRPPLTLALLLQLLAVAALGLGLARPVASATYGLLSSRTEAVQLVVLLDGSSSMSARDTADGRRRFDEAKRVTLERLSQLRSGDRATVIVLGAGSLSLQASDVGALSAMRARIEGLDVAGGTAELNGALRLVANSLLPSLRPEILLVSDGAVAADPGLIAQIPAPITLIRVGEERTGNVAVTAISTRISTETGVRQLFARVRNFSDSAQTATITIEADGFEVETREVTIAANGSQDLTEALPADATTGTVRVDSGDPLAEDDVASVVVPTGEAAGLRILLVSDAPSAIRKALGVLPGATVDLATATEAMSPTRTVGYDIIVYEGSAPPSPLPAAALVLVNQPQGGLLPVTSIAAGSAVTRVRAQDPLLSGVDLTGVTFGQLSVQTMVSGGTEIAGTDAGPLIIRGTVPGGELPMIVLAFDIAQSNLPQRVAFPILIANIAAELAPTPLPGSFALGEVPTIDVHADTLSVRITTDTAVSYEQNIVGQTAGGERSVSLRRVVAPGRVEIQELDATGAVTHESAFYVNAGDDRESDLRANPELPVSLASTPNQAAAGSRASRNELWPMLVAISAALLTIEWLVMVLALGRRGRRRWAR